MSIENRRIAAGRVLSEDAASGTVEYMDYDEGTGEFTIRRETNIQPVLDYAAVLRGIAKPNWKGDMHHVASVPNDVVAEFMAVRKLEGSAGMEKYIKKWLNNPENAPFRVKRGRI